MAPPPRGNNRQGRGEFRHPGDRDNRFRSNSNRRDGPHHRDEPTFARAVETKTNPHSLRVYRKGTTDGGMRLLERELWDMLRKELSKIATKANVELVNNPDSEEARKNVANVIHYDYFKDHGIIVPSSKDAKIVMAARVRNLTVDGQQFLVKEVESGPKTVVLRVQYPLDESDPPVPLETRFKAALLQSGVPANIRAGLTYFGVDKVAAAQGRKRRLIQFKATEPAVRYLVDELNSKLFFEAECNRIEYEGMKLTVLETERFGYHAAPPNQFPSRNSR